MRPGDRVTWSYNAPGGYGYVVPVAAVVLKVTAARARISVARKVSGTWVREEKTVSLDKLKARTQPCEALGETN
ncbi:hypothetical protein [Burkholderia gladioli]|uniref:hypothetical protein n=1 Tax=Burkholderia gladioli TaxID=28095 RepID=UPI00163F6D11|nr:hypothetical protein [Burkholderia gladioli]